MKAVAYRNGSIEKGGEGAMLEVAAHNPSLLLCTQFGILLAYGRELVRRPRISAELASK